MNRSRSRSPQKKNWCVECKAGFKSLSAYRRHVDEQHVQKKKLACPYCDKTFGRKHDLDRHWERNHREKERSPPRSPEVPKTPGRDLDILSIHAEPLEITAPRSLSMMKAVTTAQLTAKAGGLSSLQATRDAAVQTDVPTGQQTTERITKELIDGDEVVARVVREKIVVMSS